MVYSMQHNSLQCTMHFLCRHVQQLEMSDDCTEFWKLISMSDLWSSYLKDVKVGSLLKLSDESEQKAATESRGKLRIISIMSLTQQKQSCIYLKLCKRNIQSQPLICPLSLDQNNSYHNNYTRDKRHEHDSLDFAWNLQDHQDCFYFIQVPPIFNQNAELLPMMKKVPSLSGV